MHKQMGGSSSNILKSVSEAFNPDMADAPRTLLVILNHNSLAKMGEQALHFIRSIASTDYPNLDIVVIDNASSDGSDRLIEEELNRIGRGVLVRSEKNLGYAAGNNYGFKLFAQDSKYVCFLNNDIEIEPDWLRKIIEVMESDEKIAAAQPLILQLRRRELLDSLGGTIDRLGRAYDIGSGLKPPQNINQPFDVFYARGAAIVVRSDVFKLLSGFDEDYHIYYEETDFCWRARLLGYRIVSVPTAKVFHLGGATSGGATPQTIYLRRKNQLATLIKNYSVGNALLYPFLTTIIFLLTALKRSIFSKDVPTSHAIISAILWNLRNLKKTVRKRAEIQSMRKISEDKLSKHILGILQYNRKVRYLPKTY